MSVVESKRAELQAALQQLDKRHASLQENRERFAQHSEKWRENTSQRLDQKAGQLETKLQEIARVAVDGVEQLYNDVDSFVTGDMGGSMEDTSHILLISRLNGHTRLDKMKFRALLQHA